MSQSSEARLWQILGRALVVGGGAPLLLVGGLAFTRRMDSDALTLGIWCSCTILIGLTASAASRVLMAAQGHSYETSDWLWTVTAFAGLPLGAAIFDLEWQRTMTAGLGLGQKAILLSGVFIFSAGIIALATERMIHRIQSQAIARALSEVEQARVTAPQSPLERVR